MNKANKNKLPNYQCYMKAFPNCKAKTTAMVLSSKMLKRPNIIDYIQQRKSNAAKRVEISIEKVLQGLLRIALFDPRQLYNSKGRLKRVVDLDDDTALAVTGLHFKNIRVNKTVRSTISKIKTESRTSAWELIGRHLNMFTGEGAHQSAEQFVDEVRDFADQVKQAVPGGQI